MSANFASASSQKLLNSAPRVTTLPFSVGMWVSPGQVAAAQTFWSLCDTAGTINFYDLRQNAGTSWILRTTDDVSPLTLTATVAPVVGTFVYMVGRFISSASRRFAFLNYTGAPTHLSNTVTDAPAGIDAMALGCLNHSTPGSFFDGQIAEFWITNSDIQPDGAQLDNALLWQLAYNGPFSVPHIAKDIVEYHSFRRDLSSNSFDNEEDQIPVLGEILTNTNGVTLGPHPPLLYEGRRQPHIIRPRGIQVLFNRAAAGGVDTSESRAFDSAGAATSTFRREILDQHSSTTLAAATIVETRAVQDAKQFTSVGTATVSLVAVAENTQERAFTSVGTASVNLFAEVRDEKRATVIAAATGVGRIATTAEIRAVAQGTATLVQRLEVQDAKRFTSDGLAAVSFVATTDQAGNDQTRAFTSEGASTVTLRENLTIELSLSSASSATVSFGATVVDESGGGAAAETVRDAPFIVNVGSLMMR